MNLITLGSDRRLFEEGSNVRSRARLQGKLFKTHTIVVFSLCSVGLREENIAPNVRIIPTSSRFRLLYGLDAIRLGLRERDRVNLVSSQDPFETGLAGFILSRLLKVPLQVQVHTDFLSPHFGRHSFSNRVRVLIACFVVPRARCIRAVSVRIARGVESALGLKGSVALVPVFSRAGGELSEEAQFFGFKDYILMASRLESEKDIALALRAFARMSEDAPRVGLIIAGEGSERKSLERLTERLDIVSSVAFVGWRNDLSALQANALAFLNTSRYEGYGLSLLEAARAGCPIVSTDVGIVGELIGEGDASVVPVGDEIALARVLEYVVKHREEVRARALRLRERLPRVQNEEEYLQELQEAFALCRK